jgi:hypothetical protein
LLTNCFFMHGGRLLGILLQPRFQLHN